MHPEARPTGSLRGRTPLTLLSRLTPPGMRLPLVQQDENMDQLLINLNILSCHPRCKVSGLPTPPHPLAIRCPATHRSSRRRVALPIPAPRIIPSQPRR